MESLPAKGIASGASAVAMAGCALSLSVHLLALFGVYSKGILNFTMYLFTGLFPFFLLAVLAQEGLLSEFSFGDRMLRTLNPKFAHKVTWS